MTGRTDSVNLPIRASPYLHQQEGAEFSLGLFNGGISPGAALLMAMGTGKTITSIAVAGALYRSKRIRRALVVASLSIVGVWAEEFAKFAGFEYYLKVLDGTGAKKADALRRMYVNSLRIGAALQVAVITYESARTLESELRAWKPDLVIADEGHKIKTHNAQASKAMHRLGAAARYKLLLTGTLITGKEIDVFSQYKFLNPGIFGNSFYAFRNRYFDMVGYGNHTPVMKARMKAEFADKLHSIAFLATKEACLDLPETTDIIRYVDLEPSALRVYRDLVRDSYAELERNGRGDNASITVTNILTRMLRLSQLTGGFVGNDGGGALEQISRAKLSALEEITDEVLNDGQKLVVIARFVPEIKAICKMLEKRGVAYSCIYGGVTGRAEQVSTFQNDAKVQAFVGQIATAGLGITLTAASTLVFYSTDYSMSNHEQARARIHRVGQSRPCAYIYLTARGTVDEKVLEALRNKADLARSLIEEWGKGINPFSN